LGVELGRVVGDQFSLNRLLVGIPEGAPSYNGFATSEGHDPFVNRFQGRNAAEGWALDAIFANNPATPFSGLVLPRHLINVVVRDGNVDLWALCWKAISARRRPSSPRTFPA
jgi:hypothetical protein